MNRNVPLISLLALLVAVPGLAGDKKKHSSRAMIEKMEAVPCGAKERGLTGLGSIFGSVGVTHVNSDEKLCPQYLLRSDDMEYHVRPLDKKHPDILPVGTEAEFKMSKDKLDLRVNDKKMRHYQVIAMKPIDHSMSAPEETKYNPPRKDYNDKPIADKAYADRNTTNTTKPPDNHPQ